MRKLSVRNIPEEIYVALESLAEVNMRSVEAQVRYSIQQCVNATSDKKTSSDMYREAVSKRLIQVLNEADKINKKSSKLKPTHIAEEMGYESIGTVTDWFNGDILPTLSEMKELSEVLGCSSNWLIHGDLPVYRPKTRIDLDKYGRYAVEELTKADEKGNKVESIHLIRESGTGSLLIIREFEGVRTVDAFWPSINIIDSGCIGDESILARFFVTLCGLYYSFGKETLVHGYLVQEGVYQEICQEKQQHPLTLLQDHRTKKSVWWEDVWDKNQNDRKKEYWEGEKSTSATIQRHVDSNPRLVDEINAIKKQLPLEN